MSSGCGLGIHKEKVHMGKKCQMDNNVSSDRISHGIADVSSVIDDKTSKLNSVDADMSTVSSERILSADHTHIRSDVSSEVRQSSNEKRKSHSTSASEEVMVAYPHKQLKADSLSSSSHGYSHPTISVESKAVFQGSECSKTARLVSEFDLNEGIEANRTNYDSKMVHESNYSSNAVISEPIPVVAKMGVPIGFPKKPLQFVGELGWKRSGITSAFRPKPLTILDTAKAPVSRGFDFDLNVAPTMDDDPVDVGSKESEMFHFHKQATSGIDLNDDPIIEDACRSVYPQGETRQLLQNRDIYTSNYMRYPYAVDLSSVKGFGNVQTQPFQLGGLGREQVQMVVPIQLPYAPPGLYTGKMNSLNPAFHPPNLLPPFYTQPGALLSAYPGNVHFPESSQGLNLYPHAYTNMRQTTFSNGNIALIENGRGGNYNSSEFLIPSRNPSLKERSIGQVVSSASSVKTRDLSAIPVTPSRRN